MRFTLHDQGVAPGQESTLATPNVQPSRLEFLARGLLNWSSVDVVSIGVGMGVFWALAGFARRYARAELWLAAALVPCWMLASALAFRQLNWDNDHFGFDRGYIGAIVVSTVWSFYRSKSQNRTDPSIEADRPFDPRCIIAVPVSGFLLLQSESAWIALGPWWPVVIALGHLAVIGLLWTAVAVRSSAQSDLAPHEGMRQPSAPEEARPERAQPAKKADPLSGSTSPPPVAGSTPIRTGRLFISYRREDSADVTGRIYDRLVKQFGVKQVFKDVDSIPLGVDFREHLHHVVGTCDLVLAVLGRAWLTAAHPGGGRRLDDLKDFVRIELEAALQRGIPVIPVLVQGVSVPLESDLPTTLAPFAYRNGIPVRADPDFHRDMDRLIEGVEAHLNRTESRGESIV